MDALTTALLDLANELKDLPQPLMVGGGLGLYLRQRSLEESGRTGTVIAGEWWPPNRSTHDMDLFVPTEIIVSAEEMQAIRSALDRLGYAPVVRNFQFEKDTPLGPVKIDLLSGAVPAEQLDRVKIKLPRIRPADGGGLHAYLTPEAIAIEIEPCLHRLQGRRSDGTESELTVWVPNPFTYLLMKLHAFQDRLAGSAKGYAAHHALDCFRIIAMLNREEFGAVRALAEQYGSSDAVRTAREIIGGLFANDHSPGVIRLKTALRESGATVPDRAVHEFIAALRELFQA
jgi:hypothetical protein